MRCKTACCLNTTRQPNQAKCWSKYGICLRCMIKLHPEEYRINYNRNRKMKFKLRVRGTGEIITP